MNKSITKVLSVFLCAALLTGGAGAVSAFNHKAETKPETTAAAAKSDEKKSLAKDETVYVLAGADGSVEKIIVSDWIKNALGSASFSDKSELSDIENVKGEETYSMDGGSMKVWDAQGNDIYYQGNIEKELPVGLKISYKLDGKPVSASEIAGKSGKVTIRFDYDNRQFETVEINGKKEKIYVPFAMLSGIILDTDTFKNVEVSNGKLINDGDRTAVLGIAFPGLQQNLDIDQNDLEIPSYVEITADAKKFTLGTTITIASNEIFNQVDTEKLDSMDDFQDAIAAMRDAMAQLMDGSSKLYSGLAALLEKSGELVEGISKLADGAEALKNGASKLDNGAQELQTGAVQLSDGLNTLSGNNAELTGGAKQVFETLLATAGKQLAESGLEVPPLTIDNYARVLNGLIASLDQNAVYEKALQAVTQQVEANRPMITQKVTAAVREQVASQVTAAVKKEVSKQVTAAAEKKVAEKVIAAVTHGTMNKESYDNAVKAGLVDQKTQTAVNGAIKAQMASPQVQSMIAAGIEAQMAGDPVQGMIAAKTDEQMQSADIKAVIAKNVKVQADKAIAEAMASDEVQKQLQAASEGAKAMISLKTSLDSYNAFYLGLLKYTDGVASAAAGADQLKNGTGALKSATSQLKDGASELYSGVLQLKNGAPALIDGITQLKDGSMQLSDGLKQFNEEAVEKLAKIAQGDLDNMVTRLKATVDVSGDYKNFSGINENMDGEVRFIYRTEEIEMEK